MAGAGRRSASSRKRPGCVRAGTTSRSAARPGRASPRRRRATACRSKSCRSAASASPGCSPCAAACAAPRSTSSTPTAPPTAGFALWRAAASAARPRWCARATSRCRLRTMPRRAGCTAGATTRIVTTGESLRVQLVRDNGYRSRSHRLRADGDRSGTLRQHGLGGRPDRLQPAARRSAHGHRGDAAQLEGPSLPRGCAAAPASSRRAARDRRRRSAA